MQLEALSRLPEVDAASAAHSARCAAHLRECIKASGGSISFAEFMHEALYAPGLGYYVAGASKFGAAGDFVTAPEVSPLFGRVLARQAALVLAQIDNAVVLEFGAGSGRLAVDLLGGLRDLDALPVRYQILEVSPELKERQQKLLQAELPDIVDRVEWMDALPKSIKGLVIANEVLDAMPVERFVRRDTVQQLKVVASGDTFEFIEAAAPAVLVSAVEEIEADIGHRLADGYVSEVSLAAAPWVGDVANVLQHGCVFLFDYGLSRAQYFANDRSDGWLRCHFRHRAHNNPLLLPGIQDITAWVDFSAVAGAVVASGADIAGYLAQAQFMLGGGLDLELAAMSQLEPAAQLALSAEVKLLTLPGEMGENFKCFGFGRGLDDYPAVFSFADRTHTL
jgi:SAM-dependent MidA family methyltransferase